MLSFETFAVLGAGTTDTLIGIHLHELPFRISFNVVGVVLHLRLIAVLLLILVR